MKVPEPDQERPLAWNAITFETPVYSSDGESVGSVYEVLGAEDIFHGIVVRSGPTGENIMIPAENVTDITNRRIDTNLRSDEIRNLPPYQEEESYQLGIVGRLRKHLGWVEEHDTRE